MRLKADTAIHQQEIIKPMIQPTFEWALDPTTSGDSGFVTNATRLYERCDLPHPFEGSYRELVLGRIYGTHHPANRGTRQGSTSIYAVY